MTGFEKMIVTMYPDAVPGEDFTVKTGNDGNPALGYWNSVKLGSEPFIVALHGSYMQYAARKKALLPTFDDSDPAPWLNASHESDMVEPVVLNVTNNHTSANIPVERWETLPNGMRVRRLN